MSGRFVWYELMTSDMQGAIAFYTEVIGWKAQPYEEAKEPYTMWVASQGPLGGVMKLPEEARKMGAPPHWMSHVEVDDVDATAAKAKELGGAIHVPPSDIPKIGRFSVIADPQGASISIFKPIEAMAAHDVTKAGEFTWNELYANDSGAAFAFYSALFGWKKLSEMDMGPPGIYLIYGQGEKQYGGMMKKMVAEMPPAWVYYVHVDDIDGAMKRANDKGAKTLFGPMEVPDGTRVAQLVDPQGALFALHGSGK